MYKHHSHARTFKLMYKNQPANACAVALFVIGAHVSMETSTLTTAGGLSKCQDIRRSGDFFFLEVRVLLLFFLLLWSVALQGTQRCAVRVYHQFWTHQGAAAEWGCRDADKSYR